MKTANAASVGFYKKFIYCLFAFVGFPFLTVISSLAFIDVNKADNATEVQILSTIINVSYIIFPVIIVLSTLIWHFRDKRRTDDSNDNKVIIYYCIALCRYLLAAIIMFYGFSKLMVDQLSMSYYWYGDELGKLSGLQLTWSFFGYSKIYSSIIAIAQILAGSLLMFRRTTLLGALFLLPILVNITLIDYNYDIPAKDIITVLLLMTIFIISLSLKPLLSFFIGHKTVDGSTIVSNYATNAKKPKLLKPLLVIGMLLFAFLTNFNQMKTDNNSPFEGAWEATSVKNYSDSIPEKNEKLTLRLFVSGNTATVKKTYQYEDFSLSYDSPKKNFISLQKASDSLHLKDISGSYKLIGNDKLLFTGKDGQDSIRWILKKTSK
ncbi:MAG: hypothetical protein V4535_04205 [Bacteroidota bacterium]